MSTHMISDRVRPEAVEHNEQLLAELLAELADTPTPGLRYEVFRLPDGVSYIHLVGYDKHDSGPLKRHPAMAAFHEGLHDRCDEQPTRTSLTRLGGLG